MVPYLSRKVSITEEMKTISKRLKELDVCDKVTLKSKLWEIAYLDKSTKQKVLRRNRWPNIKDQQSKRSASSSEQAKPRRTVPMLDQFHPCIHDSIENIVDVKADGNCGYRAIAALLGMGEDSWYLVTMDKEMNIIDMRYVIASRYNVILVSLSL
ncbi:hypothetical protein HKD37_12G033400 [Glycine soja]